MAAGQIRRIRLRKWCDPSKSPATDAKPHHRREAATLPPTQYQARRHPRLGRLPGRHRPSRKGGAGLTNVLLPLARRHLIGLVAAPFLLVRGAEAGAASPLMSAAVAA